MGAKVTGCPNDRNSNEPNTRCGSFARQPAKYSPATSKTAETDGLKRRQAWLNAKSSLGPPRLRERRLCVLGSGGR